MQSNMNVALSAKIDSYKAKQFNIFSDWLKIQCSCFMFSEVYYWINELLLILDHFYKTSDKRHVNYRFKSK